MVNITLKGDVVKQYPAGTTVADVAKSLGAGLYKAACAATIDGELCDLRTPLDRDCALSILTFEDDGGKKAYWHTATHVMAQAVLRLYPGAKFAIGPAIENGFYYDFDVEIPFTPEDMEKIEAEMKRIIKENLPIERCSLSEEEAKTLMADQPYKLELIADLAEAGESLSFYRQGEFVDLCAGPHLLNTGALKAVKVTQCTGAYWRGDSQNRMLSRLYGLAYPKESQLTEYLAMLEEAKKRDHRKIGRDLELFTFLDEGPGFPFFLPKGMLLRNLLMNYWRELHEAAGYSEISTPILLSADLWHRSGHWDHYKDNMYTTQIDEQPFCLKPMNCPGGMLVYKTRPHSYRELPLRIAEVGQVHRHELSGALHGLMRVRCFNQDDAHIFMTREQIKDEIKGVATLIDTVYKQTFGFDYHIELSTRPENSMGAQEDWDVATEALREAITEMGHQVVINEGDGAFYGPKLDFHLTDCIGRTWQCGTIQLDFQMPERFELEYTGPDGQKHRPIMIHRVVFGSIERFIGILTEHFAGAFPLWLAPVQLTVLPISEKQADYAQSVYERLKAAGFRVELDDRNEKIGYRIRESQLQKVPYMLVLGDKEVGEGTVSVRDRAEGDKGQMSLESLIDQLKDEVARKVIKL